MGVVPAGTAESRNDICRSRSEPPEPGSKSHSFPDISIMKSSVPRSITSAISLAGTE